MQVTAETIHTAMVELRQGKITPDEFRAIMRQSREQHGEAEHTVLKTQAMASFNGR